MSLGQFVSGIQLTATTQASIAFTCPVDGTQVTGGPATLTAGQAQYFAVVCSQGHRFLVTVDTPAVSAQVQQTS